MSHCIIYQQWFIEDLNHTNRCSNAWTRCLTYYHCQQILCFHASFFIYRYTGMYLFFYYFFLFRRSVSIRKIRSGSDKYSRKTLMIGIGLIQFATHAMEIFSKCVHLARFYKKIVNVTVHIYNLPTCMLQHWSLIIKPIIPLFTNTVHFHFHSLKITLK